MSRIAKVEPLTTARSLRGPFDYRLVERFAGVGVGSLLAVPFGRRRIVGVVVDVAGESAVAPERLLEPLEALELSIPGELVRLGRWMADEYCSTPARALSLVLPPGASGGGQRLRERTALVAALTDAGRAAAQAASDLGERQRAALGALVAGGGEVAVAQLPGGHATARRLEARGLVSLDRRVQGRRPRLVGVGAAPACAPRLTAEQARALAALTTALAAEGSEAFLLHGVTGSGKTEVYLGAAARALESGRGAIVLVPEIALTPQLVARFHARFGPTVAVLHSRLSAGERLDEWLRLRRGEARICVGPRSAVFAPVIDLGLVVVDEEHDASYKHEGDPRYDARHVAARRAREAGAVLVCGSATPRPESSHALPRLRLPHRIDARRLPAVEVVDMRDADFALHPRTRAALDDTRRAGGKAIVMLNRRGWSNFVSCRGCGRTWGCSQCDVALILHRAQGTLACHHCGHREPVPRRCDGCGSLSVARHGAGTERIERELADALGGPGFPVFRLDADAAAGAGGAAEVLAGFEAAPAGVLVGTQMVAKGHDFPEVTLGVVLDADSTLRFPDFRAEERTFALIAQLAGRAGRGPRGGRVLVQTLAPDAPSIAAAARHDSEGFLRAELERRAVLRYPPFAHLIRVVCSSAAPGAAGEAAAAVREGISAPDASVLGPAPLFRLRGRERAQGVVKAARRACAVESVRAAVETAAGQRAHRHAAFSVDVDPQ